MLCIVAPGILFFFFFLNFETNAHARYTILYAFFVFVIIYFILIILRECIANVENPAKSYEALFSTIKYKLIVNIRIESENTSAFREISNDFSATTTDRNIPDIAGRLVDF